MFKRSINTVYTHKRNIHTEEEAEEKRWKAMDPGTYGYTTGMKKATQYDVAEGVDIRGRYDEEFAKILTRDAVGFVAELEREFRSHIKYALECRREAKRRLKEGAVPGFDVATKNIREGEWVCGSAPPCVADRKVEITGPVDRKMVINALNSGAKVFMVGLTILLIFFTFEYYY